MLGRAYGRTENQCFRHGHVGQRDHANDLCTLAAAGTLSRGRLHDLSCAGTGPGRRICCASIRRTSRCDPASAATDERNIGGAPADACRAERRGACLAG
jgi:hypothetical protein